MTVPPAWQGELEALVEAVAGAPLADLTWAELVPVRDAVADALNREVNVRQAPVRGGAT